MENNRRKSLFNSDFTFLVSLSKSLSAFFKLALYLEAFFDHFQLNVQSFLNITFAFIGSNQMCGSNSPCPSSS